MKKNLALVNEILRGIVGSTAHGTAIEGQDDRDEMGVCIEPPSYVCGLRHFEQYIYRTKPEGVRSGPGDLDLTIYSLRKFCRLAAKGNPSILVLLYLPEYLILTEAGRGLLAIKQAFRSQEAGKRFLGYMTSQKKALKGERTKAVSRPELVEKHGYDTKFAMHAVRLTFQGIEYLSEGELILPVAEPQLTTLCEIRLGKISLKDVLELLEAKERELISLTEDCTWAADLALINNFLIETHQRHWLRHLEV